MGRAAIGLAAAFLFVASTVVVPFGHRAVVWGVGGVDYDERPQGLSFIIPVAQSDQVVDVRARLYETVFAEGEYAGKANAFVQTTDLQEVTLKVGIVYNVIPGEAAEFADEVGEDNLPAIFDSVAFDAIKEQAGLVLAEALAGKLGPLGDAMTAQIAPAMEPYHVNVQRVNVQDAIFDEQFILSVKEKVIADQEAAEQEKLVLAETHKREQVAQQAAAERDRATQLGLDPEQYLDWLWLQKWNGTLPTTIVSDQATSLLLGVD
jgi:regulator of protease activity HflC (stomatin/prohibitin superfamily)